MKATFSTYLCFTVRMKLCHGASVFHRKMKKHCITVPSAKRVHLGVWDCGTVSVGLGDRGVGLWDHRQRIISTGLKSHNFLNNNSTSPNHCAVTVTVLDF